MENSSQKLVQKISDLGLSDSEIAKRVSASQPTISRLRNGTSKDCMASLRVSLEGLFAQLVEKEVTHD